MSVDCRRARELAQDFLDGTIGAEQARSLAAHLDVCPYCPPLYAALRAGVAALRARANTSREAPELVLARVVERLSTETPSA